MEEFEVGHKFVQRLSGTIVTYDRLIETRVCKYYIMNFGNVYEIALTDKEMRENFAPVKG
jgi:hypothetical protein